MVYAELFVADNPDTANHHDCTLGEWLCEVL